MKLLKHLFILLLPLILLASCDHDDPIDNINNGSSSSKDEVKPDIKMITSASTGDDFTVAFRVKSVKKPAVYLYYSSHGSSTLSPSLNRGGIVTHTYDEIRSSSGYTWYYYKVTHAGFSPGQYVYYQVEATNSQGSAKSSVGHVIIKR